MHALRGSQAGEGTIISRRLAVLATVATAISMSGCSVGTPSPATYVTDVSATLNGSVFSSEQPGEIQYWFKYGTTASYGGQTPERTLKIPAGAGIRQPHPVSAPVSGLAPSTTYHYQLCTAPPRNGCVQQDRTFTTGAAGSGRSGIAFGSTPGGPGDRYSVFLMDSDGSNQTRLPGNVAATEYMPSWSGNARQLAFSSDRDGNEEIYAMDADGGNQINLTDHPANDRYPAWSPDGSKIAFSSSRSSSGAAQDVYVMNADGSNQTRLTTDPANDTAPAWSPDGGRIVFNSTRDNSSEIYVMDAAGTNQTRVSDGATDDFDPAWSPDGTKIAFASFRVGLSHIFVMDAGGANPTRITASSSSYDLDPTWSPDGTKLAFHALRNSMFDVFVIDADGGDETKLTNQGDQTGPAWSPRP